MESKIRFPLQDAEELADAALRKLGYDVTQAKRIGHHLIDSELRGFGIAGLARILSIADRLAGSKPATATKVTREAPATAQIDGQDTLVWIALGPRPEDDVDETPRATSLLTRPLRWRLKSAKKWGWP